MAFKSGGSGVSWNEVRAAEIKGAVPIGKGGFGDVTRVTYVSTHILPCPERVSLLLHCIMLNQATGGSV
jgi:hypothetical protein